MAGSIGGCFCLSMDILHRKAGAGDAIGKGRWSGLPFDKSAHLLVESSVKEAILSTIQADLSFTPLFHDAFNYRLTCNDESFPNTSACGLQEVAEGPMIDRYTPSFFFTRPYKSLKNPPKCHFHVTWSKYVFIASSLWTILKIISLYVPWRPL